MLGAQGWQLEEEEALEKLPGLQGVQRLGCAEEALRARPGGQAVQIILRRAWL